MHVRETPTSPISNRSPGAGFGVIWRVVSTPLRTNVMGISRFGLEPTAITNARHVSTGMPADRDDAIARHDAGRFRR